MKNKTVVFSITIFLISIGVYFNSIFNPFIWDDFDQIVQNPFIRDFKYIPTIFSTDLGRGASAFIRPIQTLSYMVNYAIGGLNPQGFHLVNMFIHAGVAVLIFKLLLLLTKDDYILSFFVSAYHTVHPIHTSAITYVSGRADPLAAFFTLASFVSYVIYQKSSKRSLGLLGICYALFILGLLSRENAAILPLWILLYNLVYRGQNEENRPFFKKEYIGFIIILLFYIYYRSTIIEPGQIQVMPHPLFVRLMTFVKALPIYARILLIPNDLHMQRYLPISFSFQDLRLLLSLLFLIIVFIATYINRRNRYAVFFISWIFISLIPASNLFPLNAAMAEHWVYLASIGWFAVTCKCFLDVLYRLLRHKKNNALYAIAPILFCYSIVTYQQNLLWREPVELYKSVLKFRKGGGTSAIYNNMGVEYKKLGNFEESIKAFKQALKLEPQSNSTLFNMGHSYYVASQFDLAIESFEGAYRSNSQDMDSLLYLGNCYYAKNNYKKAILFYNKIINNKQALPNTLILAHYNAGRTYRRLNRLGAARKQFQKILSINPNFTKAKEQLLQLQ